MKIPCAIYRGGTSKPIFFMEDDLPKDAKKRDQVVLEAFGTPDVRQIDLRPWTETLPLEQGQAGFEKITHHPGPTLKIVFRI